MCLISELNGLGIVVCPDVNRLTVGYVYVCENPLYVIYLPSRQLRRGAHSSGEVVPGYPVALSDLT